jgi:hypothetical protein
MNGAYLTDLLREMAQSWAGFPTNDRSFYLACAALDPPTLWQNLFPSIDERHDRLAAKELSPDNNNPIQPTVRQYICTDDHDAQKAFYTRFGAHDGTPPLPTHLATFNLL